MFSKILSLLFITALLLTNTPSFASEVESITAPQAEEMSEKGEIVIIDVRANQRCFTTGKAKNAVRIPPQTSKTLFEFVDKITEVQREKENHPKIALICNTGRTSYALTKQINAIGRDDVINILGGMEGSDGWVQSKLPTESCYQ